VQENATGPVAGKKRGRADLVKKKKRQQRNREKGEIFQARSIVLDADGEEAPGGGPQGEKSSALLGEKTAGPSCETIQSPKRKKRSFVGKNMPLNPKRKSSGGGVYEM